MLIKAKEFIEEEIEQLKNFLSQDISHHQKFLIERELRLLQSSHTGELSSTHFINFYCQENRDWAVIHDFSVENNGDSAQFDHVLINRQFNFFVIESKNFPYGIKITAEGEFLVDDGRQYQNVESPIAHNQKQIEVLEKVLKENKLMPKRLGIQIKPKIKYYFLVSPQSEVVRPPRNIFDSSMVVKADMFIKALLKKNGRNKQMGNNIKLLEKKLKKDPLIKLAFRLASLHQPSNGDYRKKFCLDNSPPRPPLDAGPQDSTALGDFCI